MRIINWTVWLIFVCTYAFALAVMGACGAAVTSPHGEAVGQWNGRLPQSSTPNPLADMAYGKASPDGREVTVPSPQDLTAYLKPKVDERAQTRATALEAPQRTAAKRARAAAPFPSSASEPLAAAKALPPTAAVPTTAETNRYAAREAKAGAQQQFKGGDAIVLSVSTLLIIVLVVLLLFLVVH